MKPSRVASGIILKPQFFKELVDTEIKFSEYVPSLLKSINNHPKLNEEQNILLTSMVNAVNMNNTTNFKKVYSKLKDSISVNTLNTDFSEMLGPIAIIRKRLLPISDLDATVFFPSRGNEPLLDYKIITESKTYKISAKSGDSTNTLKPTDVLNLIDHEERLKAKYAKTTQYKILKILKENSWKEGPIKALFSLKGKGFSETDWLKTDKYTEDTRQASENSLVKISRETLDFTPLFTEATSLKVFYVKFKMDTSGEMKWDLLKDEPNRQSNLKRITFRSKNYKGRSNGDKLGFQPK